MKRKSLHKYYEQASAGVGSAGDMGSTNCSAGKPKKQPKRKKTVGAYVIQRKQGK
jgi:hypothetical protein